MEPIRLIYGVHTMLFLGDIHGQFAHVYACCNSGEEVIQVGDLGIGFPTFPYPNAFPDNFKFIHGNHDFPDVCEKHPNYLGRHGFYDEQKGIYFISGAKSIDSDYRTLGYDLAENEELSWTELQQAVEIILYRKPRILVTHCAPLSLVPKILSTTNILGSRTESVLQTIFENYQPELWIFGHYHRRADFVQDGTRFICLHVLESIHIGV
jgi:predicted phosphodiesterase